MLIKKTLNIKGLHCKSCKDLIETEVDVLKGVKSVNLDYDSGACKIEYDESLIKEDEIIKEIEKLNYTVEKRNDKSNNNSFYFSILILLAIIAGGYYLVNNIFGFEILTKLNEGNVGYGIIFLIGLLAGFHCVGMCGGLVVVYSTSNIKNKKEKKDKIVFWPHLQYNLGRIISYTIIGGILGGLGSFFGVNPIFTGVIMILASIFMLAMGLSFLTNWKFLEKIKLSTPSFIAKYLYQQKHNKNSKGPFIIGLFNGFMPCGPLQAIQFYALASGDMIRGAFSMGIYAFGTALIMMIFGMAVSFVSVSNIGKVLKVSGVFVILLGLLIANRGLASFGYGFKMDNAQENSNIKNENKEEFQTVKMELNYMGYKPNVLCIEKRKPVRWVINVVQTSGCTNAIMIESLGIKKNLKYGENIIEFSPPENVNEIKFSCWMRMVWGKFIITDDKNEQSKKSNINNTTKESSASASCNGSCGSATCGACTGGGCGCEMKNN